MWQYGAICEGLRIFVDQVFADFSFVEQLRFWNFQRLLPLLRQTFELVRNLRGLQRIVICHLWLLADLYFDLVEVIALYFCRIGHDQIVLLCKQRMNLDFQRIRKVYVDRQLLQSLHDTIIVFIIFQTRHFRIDQRHGVMRLFLIGLAHAIRQTHIIVGVVHAYRASEVCEPEE